MDKPRILLFGVGNFGRSWAEQVIPACSDVCTFAAAVDRREECLQHVPEGVRRFTDLGEALRAIHPDLVINVTPPHLHTVYNTHLLEAGYPVLCEKPVAESAEEAESLLELYKRSGGFLMIADNYRYSPVFRRCREILASGEMGAIHAVQCHFSHYHPDFSAFYHGKLAQPLLLDVSVHHLDVARYLAGEEPLRTLCDAWGAPYAWYKDRPANAAIRTWMTGGVYFHYFGTLATPAGTTDWNGDWEIECDRGTLQIRQSRLYRFCQAEGEGTEIPVVQTVQSRVPMLREAIAALREGRISESDLTDNIKTYRWLQDAIRSSQTHAEVSASAEPERRNVP